MIMTETTRSAHSIMNSTSNSSNDPIEDLNRTLYDIGAQDLLDVWEAMEILEIPMTSVEGKNIATL